MTREQKNLALQVMRAAHPLGHVSPTEASSLLGCTPYSLNVSAKMGAMPYGSCFFAGRNLRISLDWLEAFCLGV